MRVMPDEPSALTPEDAIRRYLVFLEDPLKLRDEGEVQLRTLAVVNAEDPIEKLKALAALEKASAVDKEALQAGFIEHAGKWAEANGVSVRAFRELKVPTDVLVSAGFDVSSVRGRAVSSPVGTVGPGTPRKRSVSSAEVKEAVLAYAEPFTLNDVMTKVGGSPMTVRKAVDDLIEAGEVEKRGPVPDYTGRGRAPIQYARLH
jgi:hypothetical protein